MIVAEKHVISIRFRMVNSRLEVLQDNMDGLPIHYLHGHGDILPALEAELAGMQVREMKEIYLSRENGYAELDDDFTFQVIIDQIRLASADEIRYGLVRQDTGNKNCGAEGCC